MHSGRRLYGASVYGCSREKAAGEHSNKFSDLAHRSRLSARFFYTLCVALGQHMKQVPNRKQRETKNSTSEVEVVTDAMIRYPLQPMKEMECFDDLRKDDHDQTSNAG